ncbi:MAG: hypothetical protein SFU20_09460 [Chitinophagaceae bacterium]|nr:hypothetical protein [Chitinophagaceae bacterium]
MTKLIGIIVLVATAITSCRYGKNSSMQRTFYQDSTLESINISSNEMGIAKQINFNPSGDTNFILIQSANICMKIKFSDNKRKYIQVSDCLKGDNSRSHYVRENRGVFWVLNPGGSDTLSALGYKYLLGNEGAEIAVNNDGSVKRFSDWKQYSNNGNIYDLGEVNIGRIKIYSVKEGEIIDSFVYIKK